MATHVPLYESLQPIDIDIEYGNKNLNPIVGENIEFKKMKKKKVQRSKVVLIIARIFVIVGSISLLAAFIWYGFGDKLAKKSNSRKNAIPHIKADPEPVEHVSSNLSGQGTSSKGSDENNTPTTAAESESPDSDASTLADNSSVKDAQTPIDSAISESVQPASETNTENRSLSPGGTVVSDQDGNELIFGNREELEMMQQNDSSLITNTIAAKDDTSEDDFELVDTLQTEH